MIFSFWKQVFNNVGEWMNIEWYKKSKKIRFWNRKCYLLLTSINGLLIWFWNYSIALLAGYIKKAFTHARRIGVREIMDMYFDCRTDIDLSNRVQSNFEIFTCIFYNYFVLLLKKFRIFFLSFQDECTTKEC